MQKINETKDRNNIMMQLSQEKRLRSRFLHSKSYSKVVL